MSKRSQTSVEGKLEAVQLYLEQGQSIRTLARMFGVSETAIRDWLRKYKQDGADGLRESRTWKQYSLELKAQAVQEYVNGDFSSYQIVEKYGISSRSVLKRWVNQYNSGTILTAASKGNFHMKQGRKTAFEERVEIVHFTIAHDKDYQAAIEKYGVSYQQVYSWVRKFEKEGSQGLQDRRGKGLEGKPKLTAEEELRLKIKQLEEQNRYLEMENGLLKKLEEIERRS